MTCVSPILIGKVVDTSGAESERKHEMHECTNARSEVPPTLCALLYALIEIK